MKKYKSTKQYLEQNSYAVDIKHLYLFVVILSITITIVALALVVHVVAESLIAPQRAEIAISDDYYANWDPCTLNTVECNTEVKKKSTSQF